MIIISTAQSSSNRKKHRIYLGIAILLMLFLLLFGKGCLCTFVSITIGYSETGDPNTPEEMPSCLANVSLFYAKWPVHYYYFVTVHDKMGYTVCGYSTLDEVQLACKKLGLNLHVWDDKDSDYIDLPLEDINKRFRDWQSDIPKEKREIFEKGECTSECLIISRKDNNECPIDIGYFRPSDGYIAILGIKTANRWLEVKGVRTVDIPGIGRVQN